MALNGDDGYPRLMPPARAAARGVLPTMAMTSRHVSAELQSAAGDAFKELVERFHIDNPTFRISDDVIRRYHLAESTRGFVILCGPSGTGKTWLAQAYANVIGARQKLVAVDPSWSSNEDLLGYLSPLDGFFHGTPFSEFVKEAAREWEAANREIRQPRFFHVILDEMNLARVEHYFSRFLSAMEVRTRDGQARLDLAPGHHVELTPNLRFTGTVNVDETTHGFADKVFDRAQVLELPLPRQEVIAHLGHAPHAQVLLGVWDALRPVTPFGFRVLDEISTYLIGASEIGTDWKTALDEQLVQKILPRMRSDASAGPAIDQFLEVLGADFPLATAKASKMRDDLEAHGYLEFF
jgi:AAA domain (dynein-related subfamily)